MNHKPFPWEEFKSIYSRVPRLCVDLVVRNGSGVVLTVRALPSWKGQWHLPGGTVLHKEHIEAAIHRMAKHEMGIDVYVRQLLGYIEYHSTEQEQGFGYSVGLVFLCDLKAGALRVNEDASHIDTFSEIPENTIIEQRDFLNAHWSDIVKN